MSDNNEGMTPDFLKGIENLDEADRQAISENMQKGIDQINQRGAEDVRQAKLSQAEQYVDRLCKEFSEQNGHRPAIWQVAEFKKQAGASFGVEVW